MEDLHLSFMTSLNLDHFAVFLQNFLTTIVNSKQVTPEVNPLSTSNATLWLSYLMRSSSLPRGKGRDFFMTITASTKLHAIYTQEFSILSYIIISATASNSSHHQGMQLLTFWLTDLSLCHCFFFSSL